MIINDHAREYTREIEGNIHVDLLSTELEQVRNTILWAFPDIHEVNVGCSKYFAQSGVIYNATIDYANKRVIMVKS